MKNGRKGFRPGQRWNLIWTKVPGDCSLKSMKNPNFLVQVLPVLTITLFIVFFIVYKILSRIRNQAKGNPSGGKFSEFKPAPPEKTPFIDRLKLECPAIIEQSQGYTKVGIKELSLIGAFVTCPHPLPVGDNFQIKLIIKKGKSLTLTADVLWNNLNVPQDQIVNRGMKIRFLQVSDDERRILKDIVSSS
jgi:hypothetical protein